MVGRSLAMNFATYCYLASRMLVKVDNHLVSSMQGSGDNPENSCARSISLDARPDGSQLNYGSYSLYAVVVQCMISRALNFFLALPFVVDRINVLLG